MEAGTKVTSRGEVEFKGLFRVVEWLFGKQIDIQVQSDFDALKLLLEGN